MATRKMVIETAGKRATIKIADFNKDSLIRVVMTRDVDIGEVDRLKRAYMNKYRVDPRFIVTQPKGESDG